MIIELFQRRIESGRRPLLSDSSCTGEPLKIIGSRQNRGIQPSLRRLLLPNLVAMLFAAVSAADPGDANERPQRVKIPAADVTRIEGTARNTRHGATVMAHDGRLVTCLDRDAWDKEVIGKSVMIAGVFKRTSGTATTPGGSVEEVPRFVSLPLALGDCEAWLSYGGVARTGILRIWRGKNARGRIHERLQIRIPVEIMFEDAERLALGRASIWGGGAESDRTSFVLDDSALGIPVDERLRSLCPDAPATCAVWIEGYWGPLLPLPGERHGTAQDYVFAVLEVPELLTATERKEAGAFVEIPPR